VTFFCFLRDGRLKRTKPAEMADALGQEEWATLAAGAGLKGLRLYDRARTRFLALPCDFGALDP
jgi:hypothetical protein